MPPLLRFLLRRLLAIPVTLLIVTAALYALALLTPPEARALLYMPALREEVSQAARENLLNGIIERYGLDDPFPVQYGNWLARMVRGEWGYSPSVRQGILVALVERTPATLELMLYTLLVFLPIGMASGLVAGGRSGGRTDRWFRLGAFVATSIPSFVLALVLLSVFYVGVRWFPPERIGTGLRFFVQSDEFRQYTGLLTVDGLLNRRPDVTRDALRHLVLPVLTLSLSQWATVGRIMRVSTIGELDRAYTVAARARGVGARPLLWKHIARNALTPALTSSILSAASLLTGTLIVERIFRIGGISEIMVATFEQGTVDVAAALGFTVYSVLFVLPLILVLEVLQALVDPRIREGVIGS